MFSGTTAGVKAATAAVLDPRRPPVRADCSIRHNMNERSASPWVQVHGQQTFFTKLPYKLPPNVSRNNSRQPIRPSFQQHATSDYNSPSSLNAHRPARPSVFPPPHLPLPFPWRSLQQPGWRHQPHLRLHALLGSCCCAKTPPIQTAAPPTLLILLPSIDAVQFFVHSVGIIS